MFCPHCGTQLPNGAAFCPGCGNSTASAPPPDQNYANANNINDHNAYAPPHQTIYPYSQKERIVAIILCCIGFCGLSGLHRFYTGKIGTGILWLLTGGCFAIGTIVDLIQLIEGRFTDINGYPLA